MSESEKIQKPKSFHRKKLAPYIALAFILLVALAIFLYWILHARFILTTKDAYVQGNQVEVYSQINGYVTSLNVEETQYVQAGDILAQLDQTDAQLAFNHSQSKLANVVREVVSKFDRVYQLKAAVQVKQMQVDQALTHYQNRAPLVEMGGVSKEEFQDAQIQLEEAEASLKQVMEDLKGAEAQVYNTSVYTHPLVLEAEDQLRTAWVNLQRTVIRAPVEGYIGQKNVQLGESVNPNRPIVSIIPLDQLWVNANFKEVKLSKIYIGQKVELISDIYGKKMPFSGTIVGISPGTGSSFSVLPAENATGNWIKIIQRVPVRIAFDSKSLKQHPLRIGLSMEAKIHLKQSSSSKKNQTNFSDALVETQVFSGQMNGVDAIIQQTIEQNIQTSSFESCP